MLLRGWGLPPWPRSSLNIYELGAVMRLNPNGRVRPDQPVANRILLLGHSNPRR